MTQSGYAAAASCTGGSRPRDEDRNQGDWTQIQQIKLQPQMRLTVTGVVGASTRA